MTAEIQADESPVEENQEADESPVFDITISLLDNERNVRTLKEIEGEIIRIVIDYYEGNVSKAAKSLGIGRSTLYRKFREMQE